MSQKSVYQAIDEMRELSKNGDPFSFSFMSYSDTKQTTNGVTLVRRARLKLTHKEDEYHNAKMIEEYIDLDTMEHRRFYQPALMTFNGNRLTLT
jgi:hypothetical protein